MIRNDIEGRGIKDKRVVIEVMGKIPRHLFVDDSMRDRAYSDYPLPIGEGQTISQVNIPSFSISDWIQGSYFLTV